MESFTELHTNVFSETPGPSFAGEDLDFENLNFDENCEPDEAAGVRRRDGAMLQEATGESAALFGEEVEDVSYETEKVYKKHNEEESGEENQGGGVSLAFLDRASKEDYTSSEGESDEGEEDFEEPGELLASVCCSDEIREKEDRIFAKGQPLTPQSVGNPRLINEEQGEAGHDEELSYFGQPPEKGSETVVKSDVSEEDEQPSSDPASEGVKIFSEEQEAHRPASPQPTSAGLDFLCLSLQNLITEVDGEECVEKMEFSGEEHQEAGETFADYPSDFSSCEYTEDGARDRESDGSVGPRDCSSTYQTSRRLEKDVPDVTWSGITETTKDDEEADPLGLEGPGVAGSTGNKEESVVEVMEVDGEETWESDSSSSSDDKENVTMRRRSSKETSGNWSWQDPESKTQPEDSWLHSGGRAMLCSSDDTHPTETHTSDVKRRHADHDSSSTLERDDLISSSSQGSLDDSFFFDTGGGASGVAWEGSGEYEERNWEYEQERIKAFYDYYDDSDEENEREGRRTKVQFCADPLSEIIHYETDSSDGDSLSSSTNRDDDRSSADTSDELAEGDMRRLNPECDPASVELQDGAPDVRDAHIHSRQHRCLSSMKLLVKMSLVMAAGLLVFWLAANDADWLHHVSIFWGGCSSFHR